MKEIQVPKFISFEGIDGSGKATASKKLYEYLISSGFDAVWTREIGGTDTAEKIRDIVVSTELIKNTELLLILAARSENIEQVIKPALKKGSIVICDRFLDSSLAYQSDNQQEMEKIYRLHQDLFQNLLPSKTFFLKIDPDVALNRALTRGDVNKFERKSLDYRKKVALNYDLLAKIHSDRFIEIDATKSPDEILKEIVDNVV